MKEWKKNRKKSHSFPHLKPLTFNFELFEALCAIIAALLLCSCSGGPGGIDPRLLGGVGDAAASAGKVHVRLDMLGKETRKGEGIISSFLENELASEDIQLAPAAAGAELVILGTVRLRHLGATPRLGLDLYRYSAHAEWQVLRVKLYKPIVKRVTDIEGFGVGKEDAIRSAMKDLAGQIAAEVLPHLRRELTRR